MDTSRPGLIWVIVDGMPRHVSDFVSFPPRQRPEATCPQCARRLTLKLGTVRRHHAAHTPGDICASTQPETALHLHTKLALAAALARAATERRLSILEACVGAANQACDAERVTVFAEAWDDVRIEHGVGERRRPDIVLVRDRRPIAAIEVLVSNRVPQEKADVLARLGVPWIEVRAVADLVAPGAWTPAAALPIVRTSAHDGWRCATHAPIHENMLIEAAERRAAAREAERHAHVLRAARVVDFYHTAGLRERFIYRVIESLVDGVPRSLRLERDRAVITSVEVPVFVDVRSAWPHVRRAFTEDVDRLSRDGALADSPMHWATGALAESVVDEAMADRVGRDPTPLATRYPRRWFFSPDDKRWFLPADMRGVRWDRDSSDAFAPHPAWLRAGSKVRERPAPEGSWSTPVFAQRPLAAMFGLTSAISATRDVDASVAVVDVRSDRGQRRAIVVIERATPPGRIQLLASRLTAEGIDAVWLSHPREWNEELSGLVWAPAGRDQYGRGGVVIDGLGVFRAEAFMRALKKGDRRLAGDAIKRRMRGRVDRLHANG